MFAHHLICDREEKEEKNEIEMKKVDEGGILALNGFQCYSFIHPFTFLVSFFSVPSLPLF